MAARESEEVEIGNDVSPRVNEYVGDILVRAKAVLIAPTPPGEIVENANGSK